MTKHRKYKGGSAQSAMEHRTALNREHNRMIQSGGGKFFNPPFQENGGTSTATATELQNTRNQQDAFAASDGNAGKSQPAPVTGGGKGKSRKGKSKKGKKRRTKQNKKSRKNRSRKNRSRKNRSRK